VLTAALGATLLSGCIEGSFLITPVAARNRLVEEELRRDSFLARDKIALLDVSGVMINDHEPKLFGHGEHAVSLLLEQLDKARQDRAVKAVILRINSPGGSVVASELMHDEVVHFRQKTGKPVIALMMDVAASGGYYLACACDEIVAQPSTITGSIGVIMQTFEVSGTMELIGVTGDAIISGPHKDTGSPFRKMRPEERELFQGIVNDMYERFVHVVDEGRPKLDEAKVRELADGRVYIAEQALEHGLIDRIATVRETIGAVKNRIGAKRIRLVTYKRPLAYRPNYYAQAPYPPDRSVNIINVDLPGWLDAGTPRFMYLWRPGN
jgi:protease-4